MSRLFLKAKIKGSLQLLNTVLSPKHLLANEKCASRRTCSTTSGSLRSRRKTFFSLPIKLLYGKLEKTSAKKLFACVHI